MCASQLLRWLVAGFSLLAGMGTYTARAGAADCGCPERSAVAVPSVVLSKGPSFADSVLATLPTSTPMCRAIRSAWQMARAASVNDGASTLRFARELASAEAMKNCPSLRLDYLYFLARGLVTIGKLDSAAIVFRRVEEQSQRIKDTLLMARTWSGQSLLYSRLNDEERALEFARKAVAITEHYSDIEIRGPALSSLAGRFGIWFDRTGDTSYVDSARHYSTEALPFLRATKNAVFLSQALNTLAGCAYTLGDDALAQRYLDTARHVIGTLEIPGQIRRMFVTQWGVYTRRGQHRKALVIADSILHYARKNGNPNSIVDALDRKALSMASLGRYADAYRMASEARSLRDSTINGEQIAAMAKLELAEEAAEQNERLARAQQERSDLFRAHAEATLERTSWMAIALIALLAGVMVVLVLRHRSIKQEQRLVEAEQQLLRSRMNPHALFNMATSLQSMALRQVPPMEMSTAIARFAHMMRHLLEGSYRETIRLSEELQCAHHTVEVFGLTSQQTVNLCVTIDPECSPHDVLVPSLILQPLVENAIVHGQDDGSGIHEITLDVTATSESIIIDIGNPIHPGTLGRAHGAYPSRALEIVRARLRLLAQRSRKTATIESMVGDHGRYLVRLTLPRETHHSGVEV